MVAILDSTRPLSFYTLFEVGIPAELVTDIDPTVLPTTWANSPAPGELRAIGDRWLDDRKSAALRVPSAVTAAATAAEPNYLLNPEHPDFHLITIGRGTRYSVDARLI